MAGIIVLAILAGAVTGISMLILGSGFWISLLGYSCAGALTLLLLAALRLGFPPGGNGVAVGFSRDLHPPAPRLRNAH